MKRSFNMAGFTTSFAKALACLTLGAVALTSCDEVIDEVMDEILVESISVSPTSKSMLEGETTTLTATITPSDALLQTVTWSSSDTSVATVDDGEVTAIAAGEATITAKSVDGGYTATCAITVSADYVAVTSIEMSSPTLSIEQGQTDTLTVTVLPTGATYQSVTWSSSDDAVATVVDGVVTAVAKGEAVITATSDDEDADIDPVTCAVTVTKVDVTGISIAATLALNIGGSEELTATLTPENATIQGVTWSLKTDGDADIVSVVDGTVTALAAGTATVVATSDDDDTISSECVVTVSSVAVTAIALSQTAIEVTEGSSTTLTVIATPDDASDVSVTWSIVYDGEYGADDITVVDGVVKGVTVGATATVTATLVADDTITASCTVEVVEAAVIEGLSTIGGLIAATVEAGGSLVINENSEVTFNAIITNSSTSSNVLHKIAMLQGFDASGAVATAPYNGLFLNNCLAADLKELAQTNSLTTDGESFGLKVTVTIPSYADSGFSATITKLTAGAYQISYTDTEADNTAHMTPIEVVEMTPIDVTNELDDLISYASMFVTVPDAKLSLSGDSWVANSVHNFIPLSANNVTTETSSDFRIYIKTTVGWTTGYQATESGSVTGTVMGYNTSTDYTAVTAAGTGIAPRWITDIADFCVAE